MTGAPYIPMGRHRVAKSDRSPRAPEIPLRYIWNSPEWEPKEKEELKFLSQGKFDKGSLNTQNNTLLFFSQPEIQSGTTEVVDTLTQDEGFILNVYFFRLSDRRAECCHLNNGQELEVQDSGCKVLEAV